MFQKLITFLLSHKLSNLSSKSVPGENVRYLEGNTYQQNKMLVGYVFLQNRRVFLYVLTFRLNSLVLSCHKAVLGSCTKNTWVGLKILLLTPLNSCKCPQVTLTTCTGLIRAAASIWQPCWIVIKQPHALHLLM